MVILALSIISLSTIALIFTYWLMRRGSKEGARIMRSQEALIQEGNLKAAAMTTEDVQHLVDKQYNFKLLLMGTITVLSISVYVGFEYLNFAEYVIDWLKA